MQIASSIHQSATRITVVSVFARCASLTIHVQTPVLLSWPAYCVPASLPSYSFRTAVGATLVPRTPAGYK
eukprot:1480544-Pleurochrysis_carterae.AAC.1